MTPNRRLHGHIDSCTATEHQRRLPWDHPTRPPGRAQRALAGGRGVAVAAVNVHRRLRSAGVGTRRTGSIALGCRLCRSLRPAHRRTPGTSEHGVRAGPAHPGHRVLASPLGGTPRSWSPWPGRLPSGGSVRGWAASPMGHASLVTSASVPARSWPWPLGRPPSIANHPIPSRQTSPDGSPRGLGPLPLAKPR